MPPPTVPFHNLTQIEVLEAGGGKAVVCAPDIPDLKNHFGTMHGGMLYTVGEVAAAIGITRMLGDYLSGLRAVTSTGSIEYLKPALGAVIAKSQVKMTTDEILASLVEQPSIIVPIDVELTNEDDITVGKMHIEWFVGLAKANPSTTQNPDIK